MGKMRTILLALTVSLVGNIAAAAPVACPHLQQMALNQHLESVDTAKTTESVEQQSQSIQVADNSDKADQKEEPKTKKTASKKSGGSKFKGLFDVLIPSNLKNNTKK